MCGKSFTRMNNLQKHIDSTHKQIKEFQCEFCEGTFVTATILKVIFEWSLNINFPIMQSTVWAIAPPERRGVH